MLIHPWTLPPWHRLLRPWRLEEKDCQNTRQEVLIEESLINQQTMKGKTRNGDRYSPSNTHGFHTIKRDRRNPGKGENHSRGFRAWKHPMLAYYRLNIGLISPI